MAGGLSETDLANLRNRFKRDAELLLQSGSEEEEKKPYTCIKDAVVFFVPLDCNAGKEKADPKPLPRFNRHSVFWILASVGLTYYVDFFRVVLENEDVNSWWFNVGLVLLGVCLSLATFCIVYLEWFKGIQHYDQEYPAIPPVTTAAFIAASISFNIALWPVWSFFTPVILFTQFMGVVMIISLLG